MSQVTSIEYRSRSEIYLCYKCIRTSVPTPYSSPVSVSRNYVIFRDDRPLISKPARNIVNVCDPVNGEFVLENLHEPSALPVDFSPCMEEAFLETNRNVGSCIA